MLSLPKILAPIDFSERSPGAAHYAGRLARQFHSELTLLHVLDPSIYELSAQEFTDPATRGLCDGWRSRTGASLADFLAEEFLNHVWFRSVPALRVKFGRLQDPT